MPRPRRLLRAAPQIPRAGTPPGIGPVTVQAEGEALAFEAPAARVQGGVGRRREARPGATFDGAAHPDVRGAAARSRTGSMAPVLVAPAPLIAARHS